MGFSYRRSSSAYIADKSVRALPFRLEAVSRFLLPAGEKPLDVDVLLASIHQILLQRGDIDRTELDHQWNRIEKRFRDWLKRLPAPISPVTRNLELLRRICEGFSNADLKHDDDVQKVILSGVADVGDTLQAVPNGPRLHVLRRRLTPSYSVWYELKDESGNIVTRTVVD